MTGRAFVLLLLLPGCAAPHVRTSGVDRRVAVVREASIEVVNATGRELPWPRPGIFDEIRRATGGGTGARFSMADAFAAEAASELRKKGVSVVAEPGQQLAVLRITLLDFEILNHDTAGAVAFVSARYLLVDAARESLWEAAETRLPIRLGGPDFTQSDLARIATGAVSRALSSFPAATAR